MLESLLWVGVVAFFTFVPTLVFRHLKKVAETQALLAKGGLESPARSGNGSKRGSPAQPLPQARPASARDASDRLAPVLKSLTAIEQRAAHLAAPLLHERAVLRFHQPLTGYVPEQIALIRKGLKTGAAPESMQHAIDSVERVVDELEALIDQRRDRDLAGKLGDADALAQACYAPVGIFAHGRGMPLTSIVPATRLGPFEMSTWTGFIPTSVAPIFLPADFFQRAVWWPAVGHEIAHDFLACVDGLEGSLRAELGFRPFHQAYLPIDFARGFSDAEVKRVVGAWFEELFADVFGTMMCGPAYVATMSELFASKSDPRELFVVGIDPDGRGYDCHPPAQLRMTVGLSVLSRAGFHRDAEKLRKKWESRNNFKAMAGASAEEGLELFLLFPTADGYVRVALEPFETECIALATRLYAGGLKSLGGIGLKDIPGLDFGPHAREEGLRAKQALLEGRVPNVRDVRAVISGAVLASQDSPSNEAQILHLARRAIPAFGTFEIRPDAYSRGLQGFVHRIDLEMVREAIVLREVLQRPGGRGVRR